MPALDGDGFKSMLSRIQHLVAYVNSDIGFYKHIKKRSAKISWKFNPKNAS